VKKGLFLIYILFNKTKEIIIKKKTWKGTILNTLTQGEGGGERERGIGWERSMDLRGNYKGCHWHWFFTDVGENSSAGCCLADVT
jgi:hypothetical protein